MPEHDEAREELIDAAQRIHGALATLNLHGDDIDGRIATETPGCPYGDISAGLRSLAEILWPGLGAQIVSDTHYSGTTLRESAAFFTRRATRLAGLSEAASDGG